jgi:hypothetical protein
MKCQSAKKFASLRNLGSFHQAGYSDKSALSAEKQVNDFLIIWKCGAKDIWQPLMVKQLPF